MFFTRRVARVLLCANAVVGDWDGKIHEIDPWSYKSVLVSGVVT